MNFSTSTLETTPGLSFRLTIICGNCLLAQVDLFFYREPEEAKEPEEEEALPPADFGIADYSAAPLASDQWTSQIPDAQWGAADALPPPAAVVPASGAEWAPEPG